MTAGIDRCAGCGTELERPGDFCLSCGSTNAEAVVAELDDEHATVTMLGDEVVLGETIVTTTAEPDDAFAATATRNYVGRVVDEVRRKRPEAVYLAGERRLARTVQARLHYPCYRVDDSSPVEAALEARRTRDLEVVETPAAEKVGGRHTTLIGGRDGREAVLTAAEHPHVKKVVPGPIESGGASGSSGVRAKVTRADEHGNLRLLLRSGSSVQENHLVTTASARDLGERIAADLNDALEAAGFE